METTDDIIEDIVNNPVVEDAAEKIEDTTDEVVQTEDTTETAEEVVGQQEEINIPEDWEAPIKDFFGSEIFKDRFEDKKAFFDKFKSLTDGYQGKFQTLSDERKTFEESQKSFEDNRGLVSNYKALEEQSRAINEDLFNKETARFGGTNQYYQNLHQVNSMMEKDPLGTIANMCQAYNITPEQLTNGQQDPQYQQRQQQVQSQASMEEYKSQVLKEVEEKLANEKAQQQVNNLFTARDESGNLKYPSLDVIQGDVGLLMESKDINIDEAYKLAKLMNPEVFKEELSQKATEQAKNEEIERAKVVKGVKSSAKSANTTQTNMSIDDITAEIMRDGGMEI